MTMLEKVANAEGFESCEDAIIETCLTYEDLGELFTDLLRYHGGANGHDDEAVEFLVRMLREYLDDII